uniref:Glutathione S-transferase n=1 Tax=Globodera rostochiensis TaxID=31243 RepID=A0A914HV16_GLORO
MAKFKVKYLNLRGRAESIRLLLNYVQQPYEDSRENFLEFANYRDKLPLAHLPKLVVDNKFELCYSSVILQYLGEKFGLENETAEEKAICAMLAQRINDHFEYLKPYVNCLLGLIPANNLPSLAERCLRPCITEDFGPVFERHLEANNTGYLVGDKLTWVDFFAASFADLALTFGRFDILDRFPRVLHHCRAVYSLPQLQQHIKNRPDTLF